MDQANSYGMDPYVSPIFRALCAQFGMIALDARDRLQSLKREPKTSLQDYANQVGKLAQIAYSHPNLEDCQTLEFEVIFRTMNNSGFCVTSWLQG